MSCFEKLEQFQFVEEKNRDRAEEIMDEDHLNDIYDYFKESTTDKIDDAMDELGDDYTEDEIRLVRIKFISEMAN